MSVRKAEGQGKNMKRRGVCAAGLLALCMLLLEIAFGESLHLSQIKERYEGRRWQADYESVRGEQIRVDVEIFLPQAETLGVLEATFHERVKINADRVSQDGYSVTGEDYFDTAPGWLSIGWPEYGVRQRLVREEEKAGKKPNPSADRTGITLPFGTFDLHTPYAVNNDRTLQDAVELMDTYARRYFPGEEIELSPRWVRAVTEAGRYKRNRKASGGYERVKVYPEYRGALSVDFDQVIGGVPIVSPVPHNDGTSYGGGLGFYPEYEGIMQYHMHFILMTPGRVLKDNAALCDPEKILSSAGQLIESGRLRKVYSLRLGYAVRRENADRLRLVPAWAIEGELFDSAKAEYQIPPTLLSPHPLEDTTLIYDACTGELMDCIAQFDFF